jgi:cyclic dehypoxanthinyl futalosine synthase
MAPKDPSTETRQTGGAFTAYICWTFQPENTVLKAQTVGAHE